MRKLLLFCSILFVLSLLLLAGCSEKSGRELTSKPVVAREISEPITTTQTVDEPEDSVAMTVTQPADDPIVTPKTPSKDADCEQVSGTDIGGVLGGSWTKTSDCPKHPMMPGGVSVCQCSFEGPGSMYFNVETQLYDDEAEAIQVFKMYCDDETQEVGDMACRRVRSSTTSPNFVYFLKDLYFVKVSCLGGSCPLDGIAEVAKLVDAEI